MPRRKAYLCMSRTPAASRSSTACVLVLHYAVEKLFLILKDRLGQPRPGLAQTTPQGVTA